MTLISALLLALIAPAIAGLGDSAWRVRERAQATLYHLTPLALPSLLAAEKGDHAERARRASLLIERYHADNADSISRKLVNLPPIGLLGGEALNARTTEDAWAVWRPMADCLWRAYESLERSRNHSIRWRNTVSGWDFADDYDVQVEATRLYLVPIIARRGDVRQALMPFYREALQRGLILWKSR